MEESLTFDRAASFYDRTRALPDDVMVRVLDMLAGELRGRSTLEIGVGTGRFAIPLAQRGIEVVGIDLSEPMLHKLRENATGATTPIVLLGDATQLPVADDSFGAGLVCHVFHLIPAWKDALGELVRSLARGGVILHDFGDFGHGEWRVVLERFLEEAGLPGRHRGANSSEEVDDAARALGATVRYLPVFGGVRKATFERSIAAMERGTFSLTWGADEPTRARAAEAVRAWARQEYGDLEAEVELPFEVHWRAYELPG